MKSFALVLGLGLATLGLTNPASAQQPCYSYPVVYSQSAPVCQPVCQPVCSSQTVSVSYPVASQVFYSSSAPVTCTPACVTTSCTPTCYTTFRSCGYPVYRHTFFGCHTRVYYHHSCCR
ncbi:hypothetical protein [Zavarzinella formosa]|uniref:hypothetical protein n=1 Tax=Zavarzinella formosa TaxID=360055 RepID=UPI0012F925C6|nr:hypothetical protein [Zavarzinella formosa]